MHTESHPLTGKVVCLNLKAKAPDIETGDKYEVKDWWDYLTGGSWMDAQGNAVALKYAVRSGFGGLPTDDEVVYGYVGSLGHLIHQSELGDELRSQ